MDMEPSLQEFFKVLFKKMSLSAEEEGLSFSCSLAVDSASARQLLKKQSFDMVISDVSGSPSAPSLDFLKETKSLYPSVIFLIVTDLDSSKMAVKAVKMGALSYIVKPFNTDQIKQVIFSAFKESQKTPPTEKPQTVSFIGESSAMKKMMDNIKRISHSTANILITGESGTGKEMAARYIHQQSPLKNKAFVPVNCGAIPENLIESEMFGHKKGSFTGAWQDKKGFFESAQGGVLFLDEIGELPLSLQPKLLRALQEKTIRPVGSVENKKVDVRLISATNRKLEDMIKEGLFREDLFYRLNVIGLHLPPLRERKEDIGVLVEHFIKKFAGRGDKPIKSFSKNLLQKLREYNYPGNVRELENIVERILVLGEAGALSQFNFTKNKASFPQPSAGGAGRLSLPLPESGLDMEKLVGDLEKDLLNQALQKTRGVKTEAAGLLRLSLRSFRYRLKKYGLEDL